MYSTSVNFLRLFAVCGRTRNFLRLLADRILNSLRLELLAEKAQFNFFLPLACSCGARTSCATSCACIIFGLYCMVQYRSNVSLITCYCFRELYRTCILGISVRDPRKILRMSQNSILKTRFSIPGNQNSKVEP